MKIICYGDSNTFGYNPRGYFGGRYDHPWPQILARKLGCTVLNWGENGREIPGKAVEFPADADVLMIMLGTNNLLQGASPEMVCDAMARFLGSLDPDKVFLLAPPPMKPGAWVPDQRLIDNSRALARCCRVLANQLGVRFADTGQWDVPLAYDGVHLTEDGHGILAEEISKLLQDKERKR